MNDDKDNKTFCTYIIFNPLTDETYVGSGVENDRRIKHFSLLEKGRTEAVDKHGKKVKHVNRKLQNAYNRDPDNWYYESVPMETREDAFDLEQAIIDEFHGKTPLLLNLSRDARTVNIDVTDETRQKISLSRVGFKHTEEAKQKTSKALLGKPKSREAVEKQAAVMRGRKFTDEHKENLRISHTGLKQTQEQIAKRVSKLIGRTISEEHKEILRNNKLGTKGNPESIAKAVQTRRDNDSYKHTDETKEKLRIISTGRQQTPEQIEASRLKRIGAKRSDEAIERMRNSTSSLSRAKTVIANGVEYSSIANAARALGVAESTIVIRIRNNNNPDFSGYSFKVK